MSYQSAIKWTNAIVKSFSESSDMSGLSDNIRFMTDDVIRKSPEKMLNDVRDVEQFTGLMKILIVLLLDGKGVAKADEYQKIAMMDDGRKLIEIVINGFSAGTQRLDDPGRTQAVENIAKKCLAKIGALAKPGVVNDIFRVSMGVALSSESTVYHEDSAIYSFKMKVRTHLIKLTKPLNRMKELDHYFLSLAAAGPDAAAIYYEHKTDTPVNKSCMFQSLLHPEFNVDQFLRFGPIAMFYNNPMMLTEIMFVLERRPEGDCMRTLHCMLYVYGKNMVEPNCYYRQQRRNNQGSAFGYLAKLHGITQKNNADTWKKLKARLEKRIGYPAYAFSRPL